MRKGIVTINNRDNMCLPRALVVAIAHRENDPNYKKIRKDTGKLQTTKAKELMSNVSVNISEEGCGIPELHIFQAHLRNYKITVYQYGTKGSDVIFEGNTEREGDEKHLNLLYHNGHYNVITSLTAAFCCVYYCESCHVPFNNKNRHRCGRTCPQCQQTPVCSKDQESKLCEECNRYFRGHQCYINHKVLDSEGTNKCQKIKRCEQCLKTFHVRKDGEHNCGEYFCKLCQKHVPQGHLCFMQRDSRTPKTKDMLYIFYDLECKQEKIASEKILDAETTGEIHQHEPTLCVFQQRCDLCIEVKSLFFCQKCKFRVTVLMKNIISEFISYILEQRKKFKNIVVIAHNGQAYDHQFVLDYILQKTNLKPELIMRGSKIILMTIGNIKFLDSLNYFPMPLGKLPRAFELGGEFKKGYFPHFFNTTENENYIGALPPVEYYSPDTMKTEDRNIFLQWYNKHKNNEFNMQKEIVEYCVSDVKILTEACLKFRKLFLDECNVEPFLEAITIASACNLVFRRNFIKPETIGLIPKQGYRLSDNQSVEAITWLVWEENKRGKSTFI